MRSATVTDVRVRADSARKFDDVGRLVTGEEDPSYRRVSAALLALAGIAASDSICGHRLGEYPRGQDHRQAIQVLRTVDRDAASCLQHLLDLKDVAHYGTDAITPAKVETALRRSGQLLEIRDRTLRT